MNGGMIDMGIIDSKKRKASTESTLFHGSKINLKSNIQNILVVVGLSLFLSVIGALISSNFSLSVLMLYLKQPSLFLLNALPLTLLMLFINFLTTRIWISYLVSGGFYLLVQMVNYFKVGLRLEPFVPADIVLGGESTNVISISDLPINMGLIFMVFLFLVVGLGVFILIKSKSTGWLFRTVGVLFSLLLSVVLFNTCYKSTKMYDSFKVHGTIYSSVDIVRSKGFIYSFLVKANSLKLSPPEGYLAEKAGRVIGTSESKDELQVSNDVAENIEMPHVIAIMSEAFFDIDRIAGVEFDESNNPLKNFNRICDEAYHGRIVNNVYGGGTATTEFQFLTGVSTSIANWSGDAYSLYIRKNTFSLNSVFESKGYKTMAFHPGHPWFYNRFNVYEYFGFDKRFFADDVSEKTLNTHTGYIADIDAYKFLLNDFERHLDENPNNPYFNFTVTIQNHGPYANEPIGYSKILKHNSSVNEQYYHLVNNYVGGLQQNDEALGYLVDQLEKSEEPVVVAYFGDHLPFLGSEFEGFKALNYSIGLSGSVEEYLNTYETPYFIWSNETARKLFRQQGRELPMGEAPLISTNYLGSELLNYLGINDSVYFNYLNEVKQSLPVITGRVYKTSDGKFTENLSEKEKEIISQYRDSQYYMLFENEIK